MDLIKTVERNKLQIIKSGYRWRGWWEIRMPAPCGHYQEEATEIVGTGATFQDALTDFETNYPHLVCN